MLFSNKINFENRFYFIKKLKNDLTQKKPLKPSACLSTILSLPWPTSMRLSYTILLLAYIFVFSFKVWAGGELEVLKKELDANPENLKVRQSLAQMYFDKGNYDASIETLKVKAEKLPQESLALLSMTY